MTEVQERQIAISPALVTMTTLTTIAAFVIGVFLMGLPIQIYMEGGRSIHAIIGAALTVLIPTIVCGWLMWNSNPQTERAKRLCAMLTGSVLGTAAATLLWWMLLTR